MNLVKTYDSATIFCKHHNLLNLHHLCDGYNINIIPVKNDEEVLYISRLYYDLPQVRVGMYNKDCPSLKECFDRIFYEQAKVDFDESYKYEIRDGKYPVHIPNKPFCFVHDDKSRNHIITKDLPTDIDVYRPVISNTIFDYLPMIRHASEIHCIDSSFALMIDRASNINAKKYLHRYVREHSGFPSYKSDWEIIK